MRHTIAETIIDQLGGAGRLRAMLGDRLVLVDMGDGVSVRWGKHFATVRLNDSDYYDVRVGTIVGSRVKERTFEDVDAAALVELIEMETGYDLSL